MARIPAYCGACRAIRSVKDWRETTPETLTLILGPCGHHMRRTARVEWSTDRALDRAPAGFLARGRSASRTPARAAAGGGR